MSWCLHQHGSRTSISYNRAQHVCIKQVLRVSQGPLPRSMPSPWYDQERWDSLLLYFRSHSTSLLLDCSILSESFWQLKWQAPVWMSWVTRSPFITLAPGVSLASSPKSSEKKSDKIHRYYIQLVEGEVKTFWNRRHYWSSSSDSAQ